MSKPLKIIFFDVANVLLYKAREPLEVIAEHLQLDMDAVQRAQNQKNMAPAVQQAYQAVRTLDDQKRYAELSAVSFLDALGLPASKERVAVVIGAWSNQERQLMPGAREIIDYLKPRYRLGIISNAMPSRRSDELVTHNLINSFDPVVISGEMGVAKPQPEIFRAALELAEVEAEEAAFVDDMPDNLKGAKAVGFGKVFLLDFPAGGPRYDGAPVLDSLLDLKKYL